MHEQEVLALLRAGDERGVAANSKLAAMSTGRRKNVG